MTFICANPDDEAYDEIDEIGAEGIELTWAEVRQCMTAIADDCGDWQGIPLPLPDLKLILQKYHPLAPKLEAYNRVFGEIEPEIEISIGGPSEDLDACLERVRSALDPTTTQSETVEFVRARFYSRRAQATIIIWQRGWGEKAKVFHSKVRRSPDRSMERLNLALQTLGAIEAWSLEAEYKAREKLRDMTTERQFTMYELTGSFLEYSERSRLTYVFRKGRPTIAMTERNKPGWIGENMRLLAVLCMHPIGYYARTWAGCLTPTDDVIAHLVFMRGDEAGYWGQANQHDPSSPEAGL